MKITLTNLTILTNPHYCPGGSTELIRETYNFGEYGGELQGREQNWVREAQII
jgi:hypothetical protein